MTEFDSMRQQWARERKRLKTSNSWFANYNGLHNGHNIPINSAYVESCPHRGRIIVHPVDTQAFQNDKWERFAQLNSRSLDAKDIILQDLQNHPFAFNTFFDLSRKKVGMVHDLHDAQLVCGAVVHS